MKGSNCELNFIDFFFNEFLELVKFKEILILKKERQGLIDYEIFKILICFDY